jgi:hypothetical protein
MVLKKRIETSRTVLRNEAFLTPQNIIVTVTLTEPAGLERTFTVQQSKFAHFIKHDIFTLSFV